MDLKKTSWSEFVFEDIFKIYSTSSGIDKNKLNNKKGDIPYITRSDKNNGIDFFVGVQDEKFKQDSKNVITIGLDTQTVFYQSNSFYTGQNIQILSNDNLNHFTSQFIIPLIKKQMEKFSWGGNGATLTRLKRSKILLPVDLKGKPDYAFMEQYMLQKQQQKLQEYHNYISKRLIILKDFKPVEPIEKKAWGEFKIVDLFDFEKGDQNNMMSIKKGNIPLVSAKKGENGYKDFATQSNKKLYAKKSLTLNNDGDGGAGISFYQPSDYLLDNHVTSLFPKNKLSEFVLLYISRCITAQRGKFGHGYSINNQRLKVLKIMLPINHTGQPDYHYMENYIKKMLYEKLAIYMDRNNGSTSIK
ncbi:MAG: restriction endonuclease subunit S [Flavipsychrobacter sp.]|nr:restriction endonuclease subunit S [Flavipsychrobacter sp.]